MESGAGTLAVSALAAIALAMALPALKARLELSLAKHRSLSGHVRMARRVAALIPFYHYDEAHFFRCDDAPAPIPARRRAGFMRLANLYPERFPQTTCRPPEAPPAISHLHFTPPLPPPSPFT